MLKGYEQILNASVAKQQEERQARQMLADQKMAAIAAESDALRLEVQAAREQSALAEQLAERELSRDRAEIDRVNAQADAVEQEVYAKRRHVSYVCCELCEAYLFSICDFIVECIGMIVQKDMIKSCV